VGGRTTSHVIRIKNFITVEQDLHLTSTLGAEDVHCNEMFDILKVLENPGLKNSCPFLAHGTLVAFLVFAIPSCLSSESIALVSRSL